MPELYRNVYVLLARRIERHPHLFTDRRSLRVIKEQLGRVEQGIVENNKLHES